MAARVLGGGVWGRRSAMRLAATCALLGCALALGWARPASAGGMVSSVPEGPVRIRGNVVLPDEVYLTVLDLPDGVEVDAELAWQVEQRLTQFLHRAGYELASVSAALEGDHVEVAINEGRLEKVVFRGRLTLQTLRFKLGLSIPHQTFNKPALEREMGDLAQRLGVELVWYELVPSAEVVHVGPQLEELPTIQGYQLVTGKQPFELHVFFAEREWDTGLGLDLRTGYIDGLEVGVNYQGRGGLLKDDRYRAAASAGLGLRKRIGDDHTYADFSRAMAELRWYTPKLWSNFRPFVWVQGDVASRQRRDLGLENYDAATATGTLNMELEPDEGLRLSLGGGYDVRRIFGLQAAPGAVLPPDVREQERLRPFAALRVDMVFDTTNPRTDRWHQLSAETREYIGNEAEQFGYAQQRYQRVVELGWHDLWVKTRGKWLWGDVAFHNEEPVGEYLHGLFGEEFTRKIGNLALELRLSVTRDLVKVGIFHDLATYAELDRSTGRETLRLADAFGPSFHTLIEGMLQLDVYVSFGFKSNGQFATALAASLLKVF